MKIAVVRLASGGVQTLMAPPSRKAEMEANPASYYGRSIGKHPGDVLLGIIEDSAIPAKGLRRNAWDWSGVAIVDDNDITTEPEVDEAAAWKQAGVIATGANTPFERKVLQGRPDLFTQAEMKSVVDDWRASGDAPAESSFTPPQTAKPIPIPPRHR